MKKIIIFILFFLCNSILYNQCTPPNLYYPLNAAVIDSMPLTFQWGGQSGNFLNQRIQISTSPQFFYPVRDDYLSQSANSYIVYSGLQYNVIYYWHVGVYCYPGYYNYSSTYTFTVSLTGINIISAEIPSQFSLYQNYPNPFNPVTKIKFDIPAGSSVPQTFLSVYDILGREIAVLVNEQLNPGKYEVDWDASAFPSGVYFYTLRSGNFIGYRKMILLK